MVTCLISIAAKVAETLVDPVLRQIQYLTQFNDNVQGFMAQVDKLAKEKDSVNQLIGAAHRKGEPTLDEVTLWLSNVDKVLLESRKFDEEIKLNRSCFSGFCPNLIFRYWMSRKVVKKRYGVISLQEEGKFKRVSSPLKPVGIEEFSSKEFIALKSRESTINHIIEALKDEEIDIIGLYGVPGVGKTALANEIGVKVKKLKIFDEIVMAVVSEDPDFRAIQAQLGDQLGLKLKQETEQGRAGVIYARMKQVGKILVILDDVHKTIGLLNGLGIPVDYKGCKVLLTTTQEYVCSSIGIRTKKIQVNVLEEKEAMILLQKITGVDFKFPPFYNAAEVIVGKCGGLPLMIVTIGGRLRGKGINEWKDVAKRLKSTVTEEGQLNQDDLLNDYGY